MISHFVTRYSGPENNRLENFLLAGIRIGELFSDGDCIMKRTESGIKIQKNNSTLAVCIAYDRSEKDFTELHEIDINGDESEVKEIRNSLENIYKNQEFLIL